MSHPSVPDGSIPLDGARCLNLLGQALAASDRATFERRAKAADAACKEADRYL